MNDSKHAWIRERIEAVSNVTAPERLEIITDTTEFMNIHRGQVIDVDDRYLLITGNIYESRFGLSDEPKYWVKRAVDLESGAPRIIKMVYVEEFQATIGKLKVKCYRDPHKETRVLELVRGDDRFMQGRALFDRRGNEVRAIEYIRGVSFYDLIQDMSESHEEYFHTSMPRILRKLVDCFQAIQFLHDNDLCHGDIRSDHILVERDTGKYRWIDFDLTQDFSDYDVWSMGNVLQFCVGMGMRTFHEVLNSDAFPEAVKGSLGKDDASAFHEHRIMNLRKLFPYIPRRLNDILLHFASNTNRFYESVNQLTADVDWALEELPKASEETLN